MAHMTVAGVGARNMGSTCRNRLAAPAWQLVG
jgi:hypothetical protein